MGVIEIILAIVLIVFAIITVVIVLSQQGEEKNRGVVTGSTSDTYISRHKGRTIDAFLSKWTAFFAIGFFVLVIITNIIIRFAAGVDFAQPVDTSSSVSEAVAADAVVSDNATDAESDAALAQSEITQAESDAAEGNGSAAVSEAEKAESAIDDLESAADASKAA